MWDRLGRTGEEEAPLAEWAARRDARVGLLRVVVSDKAGGACAAGEPRAVRRWNGYAWEPYAVTRDLVEALRPVRPEGQPQGSAERCPGSWPESPEPAPPRSARCDSGNGRSREDRPSPRVVSGAGSRRGDRGRVARSGRGSA
ncbi:DUF6087 family protein [Streptomyces sp. CA-253872]|uniref:DUF6087 family protein n=1 Tax=Streptomyces sp. CA-253872 TaxID=3240067 RepID=UPI003D8AF0CB